MLPLVFHRSDYTRVSIPGLQCRTALAGAVLTEVYRVKKIAGDRFGGGKKIVLLFPAENSCEGISCPPNKCYTLKMDVLANCDFNISMFNGHNGKLCDDDGDLIEFSNSSTSSNSNSIRNDGISGGNKRSRSSSFTEFEDISSLIDNRVVESANNHNAASVSSSSTSSTSFTSSTSTSTSSSSEPTGETIQKKRRVTSGKKERECSSEGEDEVGELTRNPHQELSSRNTTGFKGVGRNGNKYTAQIKVGSTKRHLGSFDTTTKAALAYDRFVIQNKLPSSWLNFVHKK